MALSFSQRRKKSLMMKRISHKVQRGKKIAMRKLASTEKLKIRARRKAMQILRKKAVGEVGLKYAELTPGQKEMIDKAVERRKGSLDKIAKKMLPKVKKAEMKRFREYKASNNG